MEFPRPSHPRTASPQGSAGRPWKDRRTVLNGILWVLRTGAPWSDLPERYPAYETCHRRFQQWVRSGIMRGVFEALAQHLSTQGRVDVTRSLHRREFRTGKKGSSGVGKTKRGKGTKIMAVADCHGLPVAVCVESATPHEVKLAESTLVQMVVAEAPQNLIGDNAYDSDKLDATLRRYGIELISPHRCNRRNKHKIRGVCDGTAVAGRSRGCLLGSRTSVG